MSMKIERSTLDQVKARFAQNKKKLEEKKKDYDLEQRVKELKEEVCFCTKSCLRQLSHSLYNLFIIFLLFTGRKNQRIQERKEERQKEEDWRTGRGWCRTLWWNGCNYGILGFWFEKEVINFFCLNSLLSLRKRMFFTEKHCQYDLSIWRNNK